MTGESLPPQEGDHGEVGVSEEGISFAGLVTERRMQWLGELRNYMPDGDPIAPPYLDDPQGYVETAQLLLRGIQRPHRRLGDHYNRYGDDRRAGVGNNIAQGWCENQLATDGEQVDRLRALQAWCVGERLDFDKFVRPFLATTIQAVVYGPMDIARFNFRVKRDAYLVARLPDETVLDDEKLASTQQGVRQLRYGSDLPNFFSLEREKRRGIIDHVAGEFLDFCELLQSLRMSQEVWANEECVLARPVSELKLALGVNDRSHRKEIILSYLCDDEAFTNFLQTGNTEATTLPSVSDEERIALSGIDLGLLQRMQPGDVIPLFEPGRGILQNVYGSSVPDVEYAIAYLSSLETSTDLSCLRLAPRFTSEIAGDMLKKINGRCVNACLIKLPVDEAFCRNNFANWDAEKLPQESVQRFVFFTELRSRGMTPGAALLEVVYYGKNFTSAKTGYRTSSIFKKKGEPVVTVAAVSERLAKIGLSIDSVAEKCKGSFPLFQQN